MSMTAEAEAPATTVPWSSTACLEKGQAKETAGQLTEAIAWYDRARADLGVARADAAAQRLRGVCWMNRGNALQKSGTPANLREAVRAYDEGIACFETLSIETVPVVRNHLGAAWLNRGHALMSGAKPEAAVASLERAILHLSQLPLDADVSYRLNLAGAWTNLALLLHPELPGPACSAARSALALLEDREFTRSEFLEMSLRARRALVVALGERLVTADAAGESTTELADEAVDAIEGGLSLLRRCERPEVVRFRALAARLFRLGVQLYRIHQPHFLAEFVLETVEYPAFENEADVVSAARDAIAETVADLHRPQLILAGTPAATRLLETLSSLRTAQHRLTCLGASDSLLLS